MTTIMGGCLESCSFRLCLVASREKYERNHQGKEKGKKKMFSSVCLGVGRKRRKTNYFPCLVFKENGKENICFYIYTHEDMICKKNRMVDW